MRRLRLSLLLLLCSLIFGASPVLAQGQGVVEGLNPLGDNFLAVRDGPGTRHPEVGRLYNGDVVTILSSTQGWYEIETGGLWGWVSQRYLRPVSAPQQQRQPAPSLAVVEGLNPLGDNFLAVRSGPSAQQRQLGSVHNGDVVTVLERRGKWWRIQAQDGLTGWAFSDYLRAVR